MSVELNKKKTVARWATPSGKWWVELYVNADGVYMYDATNSCGSLGRTSETEALREMERQIGCGDFQAGKTPVQRVALTPSVSLNKDMSASREALESVRKDANDPTLSVGDIVFSGGVYAAVTEIKTRAPGAHNDSPIRNDWMAIQVVTDMGTSRWHGRKPEASPVPQSGYTPCACRDCMDTTVSSDTATSELCSECADAGCVAIAPYNEGIQFCSTYECQRDDAYGEC